MADDREPGKAAGRKARGPRHARPRRPARRRPNEARPANDKPAQASGEDAATLDGDAAREAAEEILGANPLIGFDRAEMLDAARRLARLLAARPDIVLAEHVALAREWLGVVAGRGTRTADPKDRRFSHEVWRESPWFRRLAQGYLAWRATLHRVLDRADATDDDRERARFILSLLTEALAPTNTLLGNPGGIQRAIETRGRSLLWGARNFLDDVLENGGMPRMVDERKFQVGRNVAATPGAVVYRDEVFELLQYAPTSTHVRTEPLLIVPPQINKYYAVDLAPGRSFAEYAAANGVQLFCISWRNPTAAQRDWNLGTYLDACSTAIDVARDIAGTDRVHTMAACAGGFTLATLLGRLARAGDHRVASVTLLVTVLDTSAPTLLGQFASRSGIAAAMARSRAKGVLEGAEMARVFAWLRPNDLVWLFVANNWVMGNRPPAFDILYWNSDTTRLPAEFHADLLRMLVENPLKKPAAMQKVDVPSYVVAGITDHITPWQACYASRKILRGPMQFVLSSSGHIQSIVNPPGNPKAQFYVNPDTSLPAAKWLETATVQPGSWWDHWRGWFEERAGERRTAPRALGNARFPAGDPAPGRYVHQR
ncbi:MAG: PHA/PHB synthase family protein [Steroidobacteraceae bacterium]